MHCLSKNHHEDISMCVYLPERGDELAVPLDVLRRHINHTELIQRRQTLADVLRMKHISRVVQFQ